MKTLAYLRDERDLEIRRLWSIFEHMSRYQGTSMSDEDLDLWGKVTAHSAVQNKLKDTSKPKNERGK